MSVELPVIGTGEIYRVRPTKIIAVGLNYREHIAESESVRVRGMDGIEPDEPVLFNKTPNVLIGSTDAIPLPALLSDYSWNHDARTDYEGELVVIIGRTCRHVPAENALNYVYGYTCGNDVSQRNIQNTDRSGWFRGKSFDGFGPVGPVVKLSGDLKDPGNLDITTRLNGKTVQHSNTSMMIFPVPVLISYISRQFTLTEGDLIFTGTPAGVGPLNSGDTVEVEIGGIGTLTNTVVNEKKGVLK